MAGFGVVWRQIERLRENWKSWVLNEVKVAHFQTTDPESSRRKSPKIKNFSNILPNHTSMIDFEPIPSLPDFSTPLWRSRNLRFVGHTSISPCMDGSTQQPKPTVADKFSRSGRVKGNLSGSHCTEQPISVYVLEWSVSDLDTDWLFGTMGAAQVVLHPPRTGKFVSDGWFRLLSWSVHAWTDWSMAYESEISGTP